MYVTTIMPYKNYYAVCITTKEDVKISLRVKDISAATLLVETLKETLWEADKPRPMGEVAPLFDSDEEEQA